MKYLVAGPHGLLKNPHNNAKNVGVEPQQQGGDGFLVAYGEKSKAKAVQQPPDFDKENVFDDAALAEAFAQEKAQGSPGKTYVVYKAEYQFTAIVAPPEKVHVA